MGISDIDTIIETLDTELGDIGIQVDEIIATAQNHLRERLEQGEIESDSLSVRSSNSSKFDDKRSESPSEVERKRLEAQAANSKLIRMQKSNKKRVN